jgi:methionine-rich copper-binding protein CopC
MNLRISIVALIVLISLAVIGVQSVTAHARLLRSIPADKAQLEKAPAQIELKYNELLEDNFNDMKVFPVAQFRSKQRTDFVAGKPKVDAKDRTRLLIDLKPMPPGEYMVEWRVLSRDGHSAFGRFTFRILEPK